MNFYGNVKDKTRSLHTSYLAESVPLYFGLTPINMSQKSVCTSTQTYLLTSI